MKLVKLPVIFEFLQKWEVKKLCKNSIFVPTGFEKDVVKHLNVSLNIIQRVLPTLHVCYTHLTSAMFEQSHRCVSPLIKDTCVRKFHSEREVVVAYFFLYLLCFEFFNNIKKPYSNLFWIRTWDLRRHLLKFLNIFMMKRNIQKSSSFMLTFKLAGTLYLPTWRKLLMIMCETSSLSTADLPRRAIAKETFKQQSERKNWPFTTNYG